MGVILNNFLGQNDERARKPTTRLKTKKLYSTTYILLNGGDKTKMEENIVFNLY